MDSVYVKILQRKIIRYRSLDRWLVEERIFRSCREAAWFNYLLYVWRCFGDGIVFKFISKWNLKRLLFDVDSPEIKQQAGHLSGKKGFKREWQLLELAAKNKVPAILCDITNSIRHGDICLLGASDPYILEVKSSENTNKRVDRQKEAISRIHEYLENDVGTIGGLEGMQRVDLSPEEMHYNSTINELIKKMRKDRKSIKISPEPGLHYIGLFNASKNDYDNLFKDINEPIVYMLNQFKTEKRWDNYYPFTLSINDSESLYEFIKGEFYLIVTIDGTVLKKMFMDFGYELDVLMTENAGFVVKEIKKGDEEPIINIISDHFAGRLGLEFISLSWFVKHELHSIKEMKDSFSKDNLNNYPLENIIDINTLKHIFPEVYK